MNLRSLIAPTHRRLGWFLHRITWRKAINMTTAATSFARRRPVCRAGPVVLKIDVSPLCNLHCTICVHARPNGNAVLLQQRFHKQQRMTPDRYRSIIEEIASTATAVSLFYLGDPLMHPEIDEICRITHDAGLNAHITSNFSFPPADARVRSLVESGLSHLTVCIDGLSQHTYERTRVGGRLDWAIENLRRVSALKRHGRHRRLHVEVQYLKYQHNLAELDEAKRMCRAIGVDRFTARWGALHNYTDQDPGTYHVRGPLPRARMPRCVWPWLGMVIKYNGDVIPCCWHRYGAQYAVDGDARVLGNVFTTGVRGVWDSEPYRQLRRLVSDPERAAAEPGSAGTFCDACPAIFDTDIQQNLRYGDAYRYEDVFPPDRRGAPLGPPRCSRST